MRKALAFILITAAVFSSFACSNVNNSVNDTTTDIAGAQTSDASTESEDTEVIAEPPKLTGITLDGGYTVDFDPDIADYTVNIPSGRPAVPKVYAEAEADADIQILQAVIPDGETSGSAKITVSNAQTSTVYTVSFVKDSANGFQLQYADVYSFVPDYTLNEGEKLVYTSSNSDILSVDKDGNVKALALSDSETVITASVGDAVVGTLTVDKVVKAPLNIFLIIGQSNAYGWHDVPSDTTMGIYFQKQRNLFDKPLPGTVWADNVSTAYDEYDFSGMYDMCRTKGTSGFYAALGKEWYALTGEKTLMLKTAVGSTPIEAWTADPDLKFYGIDLYGMTVERFEYYRKMFTADDSTFTINRIYAYWLQGETCEEFVYDPGEFTWDNKNGQTNYKYSGDWRAPSKSSELMSSEEYYSYFVSMYNSLVEDVGLEFIGILPVRSMESVSSAENKKEQQLVDLVAPRAAQFALNYTGYGNIAIVTLKTDIGRTESYPDENAEGWGYMGCYNIHYNQIGYNAIGKDAAYNTFRMMNAVFDRSAEDIRIYDSNGRTVIEDGATIKMDAGSIRQITAIVLPVFAEDSVLTFEFSDDTYCSIDDYGMITIPFSADAIGKIVTLTVSNGIIVKTVNIQIT